MIKMKNISQKNSRHWIHCLGPKLSQQMLADTLRQIVEIGLDSVVHRQNTRKNAVELKFQWSLPVLQQRVQLPQFCAGMRTPDCTGQHAQLLQKLFQWLKTEGYCFHRTSSGFTIPSIMSVFLRILSLVSVNFLLSVRNLTIQLLCKY